MASSPLPVPITMGARAATERDYAPFRVSAVAFSGGDELADHVHERPTFAVMLDGRFDLAIDGRRLECPAGTVFTEPAGERHANVIGPAGATVVVTQPDPGADLPAACTRFLDRVNHFRQVAVVGMARRLAAELRAPDDVTPLECRALALEMLVTACRLEMGSGGSAAWMRRVDEIIHDRFRDPLSIDDLAAEAGVHPAHLTRMFRLRYGTSPGRFLRRLRLQWAAEQLTSSALSVRRIAHDAGFAHQAHFTRAFRRYWGVPPTEYRRNQTRR